MKPRLLLGTLICCTAGTLLSCKDRGPLAPDAVMPIQAAYTATPHGLLGCRPLGYDSATVRIGPGGGTIRVSRHSLTIPPHALSRPTNITVVAPADTVNRLVFRPDGLIFDSPATLTLSYANCRDVADPKGIAYTDDALRILQYVRAKDDAVGKKVIGLIGHFSGYAVSW